MSKPMRVLIIDDESLVRWALVHMLSRHGCTVVEREDASSSTQALTAGSDPFDVILLDHKLPDGNGLDLLPSLKRLAPASTVVMMSAHMSRDEVDEALRLGASAFVSKPFDLDAVWELILHTRSRQ
jgi:DNA-binding NtrC family response regulator